MPDFSLKAFFNSSFSSKYETYLNEQFVFRDDWITLKSFSETALGKTENNGIVSGKDGYLFVKQLSIGQEQLQKNSSVLRDFLSSYQGSATVAIVPSSYEILRDKVPTGLPNLSQKQAIDNLYQSLSGKDLQLLPIIQVLSEHQEDYIFYRTDHHWTTLGAYYAYAAYCQAHGLSAIPWETIPKETVPDFYGTYFSRAKLRSAQSDSIVFCDLPITSFEADLEQYPGMYQESQFSKRDKYAAFLYGNHGLTTIRSDAGTGKKALVIKDSFANCFVPFLTQHYDEVTVVDLRYFRAGISTLLEQQSYDDLLILYNYLNFAEDTNFYRLNA